MKKFLKFLLIAIIVLIVGILIAGLVMPNEVSVTRSTLINAPKEAVFEQMVKFRNWPHWSPFYELDTTATLTYSGEDGTAGSYYTWESKKDDVGAGKMTNKAVEGTKFDYDLNFIKPWESQAHGYFSATDSAGGTKATWSFTTHMPFPFNAMQLFPFMNMEKMLGESFDKGLGKMKAYVESNPSATGSAIYEIKEVDYPAHIFQGFRKTVGWNDIGSFFGQSMGQLGAGLGDKIAGPGTGLYYSWDTVNHSTDLVAAFPVSDTTKVVKGSVIVHQEASKALLLEYKGPYGNMMAAHGALQKEITAKGKMSTLVVEEYVVGMPVEQDSTKWVTNIYYLVK